MWGEVNNSRNKIKSVYFSLVSFDENNFIDFVLGNFNVGVTYSILLKLKYHKVSEEGGSDVVCYGMGGKQIGFVLSDINDIDSIKLLYKDFKNIVSSFINWYNVDEIEFIQVLYITITSNPKLKLSNINKISLNKEFVIIKEVKTNYSSRYLPLTTDLSYFGVYLTSNHWSSYVDLINTQKSMLKKDLLGLGDIDSMYLYNNEYLIVNYKIVTNDILIGFRRGIYNAISGVFYIEVEDYIGDIKHSNIFTRKIGKTSVSVKNGNVDGIEVCKELYPIRYISKNYKAASNPFIGVIDLETFKDVDGYNKIYALGFHVGEQEPYIFYLKKNESSDSLLLRCFDVLLTSKYNGYTFYMHNFGGYDAPFIIKILYEANLKKGFEYFKLSHVIRDSKILKLGIEIEKEITAKPKAKSKVKSKSNKEVKKQLTVDKTDKKSVVKVRIKIVDSLNLLNDKLYELSLSFGVPITKGLFPHEFVSRDTLNYIGNTPSIDYWGNGLTSDEFNKLYKEDWNFKDECINYLKRDLISLYDIMEIFNKYIFINYGIQMTDSITISRLALNIFMSIYLKDSKIPVIKQNVYNDIKQAYYGGITEVYKPYGANIYYYDVNSLYPFASLNSMPGLSCTYIEKYNCNLDTLFGYFYCEIETSDNYLGLLPVVRDFELIMPVGRWKGWYFSEELKFAKINGYKIKVIKGYNFNRVDNVFNDYVKDLYKVKANNTGSIKIIAKSLLNNLLGRFGMDFNKPITKIVNEEEFDFINSTCKVKSYDMITDNHYMITFDNEISSKICYSHGLDYIKALNSKSIYTNEKDREFNDVSLTTAAAVTAYARVFMSRVKLDIINKGGEIFYSDTDSIATNIPLDKKFVGDDIGQFKLEFEVIEGYFISSKLYCLITKNPKKPVVIKSKGALKSSLNLTHFEKMYKGVDIKADKNNTTINYKKGSVDIQQGKVELSYNSYKKREKIYKSGKWVDTKPLLYNQENNIPDKK